MANRIVLRLNFAKKTALAVAGVLALAVPIVIGMMNSPHVRAQSAPADTPAFESVSIQPGCASSEAEVPRKDGARKAAGPALPSSGGLPVNASPGSVPGSLLVTCAPVAGIINAAYGKYASGRPLESGNLLHYVYAVPMSGGPAWLYTDQYHITARAPGAAQEMMRGPMMQALLEDRFKLKVRRETREAPAYALTVAGGGPKMQPYLGDCVDLSVLPPLPPGQKYCSEVGGPRKEANFSLHFAPDTSVKDLDGFSLWLFGITDRPVLNKTGLTGRFFVGFAFAPDQFTPGALTRLAMVARRNGGSVASAPSNPPGPSIFTALEEQLGLKLEPITAPRDFIIVDHAERPNAN